MMFPAMFEVCVSCISCDPVCRYIRSRLQGQAQEVGSFRCPEEDTSRERGRGCAVDRYQGDITP